VRHNHPITIYFCINGSALAARQTVVHLACASTPVLLLISFLHFHIWHDNPTTTRAALMYCSFIRGMGVLLGGHVLFASWFGRLSFCLLHHD